MPAQRPGRRAGCVQQDRIKPLIRVPLERVRNDGLRRQPHPRQVFFNGMHTRFRDIERRHARPGRGKLHRLTARSSAQIKHRFSRLRIQQPSRHRSGRILHPPVALRVAGQGRHLNLLGQAQRPGRPVCRLHRIAQSGRLRRILWRDIQRGRDCLCFFNRRHALSPIGRHGGLAQPWRHPLGGQRRPIRPAFGHPTQHGIDQALAAHRVLALARDADQIVDNAMGLGAVDKDLPRPEPQDPSNRIAWCVFQKWLQRRLGPLCPAHRLGRQPLRPRPNGRCQTVQQSR